MSNLTISVIIPTYNRPHYLRKAIDSILNQTYKLWEIIIINDGSDEGLYDQLIVEIKPYPVIWHYQNNLGPGAARKKGVELSSGAYIAFLDDDDYYLPEHFEQLITEAVTSEYKIFRSGLIGLMKSGRKIYYPRLSNQENTLKQYWNGPGCITPLLFAREVSNIVPIETDRAIEDFAWLTRVFSHYNAYQVPDYTVAYVQHEENRNNNTKSKTIVTNRIKSMEKAYAYGDVSQIISKKEKQTWICHEYLHFARNSIISGNWKFGFWGIKRGFLNFTISCLQDIVYTLLFVLKHASLQLLRDCAKLNDPSR